MTDFSGTCPPKLTGKNLKQDDVDSSEIRQIAMQQGCVFTRCLLQRVEAIHALSNAKELCRLVEATVGKLLLRRSNFIIRAICPIYFAAPAHQDLTQTRRSENAWTFWVSLVECLVELIPIAVKAGTHHRLLLTKPHMMGGLESIFSPNSPKWAFGRVPPGDCLVFDGCTVRCALKNKLRLSIDCCYRPVDEPIQRVSLVPHGEPQSWDGIY